MNLEFTCTSGQCIRLDQYCNEHLDCDDESDENKCQFISIPDQKYSQSDSPNSRNSTNPLIVSVDIVQFDDFDNLKMTMTLTMDIKIGWKDPRIRFNNLPLISESNNRENEFKEITGMN